MKKYLLIAVNCLLGTTAFAQQITIVRSDMSYPGKNYDMSTDTSVILGPSFKDGGDSMVWDFDTLDVNYQTLTRLLAPQDVPEAADFPQANMVFQDMDTVDYYIFANVTDSAMYYLGDNSDPLQSGVIDGFRPLLFPLYMGRTWVDETESVQTYSGDDFGIPADSVRITLTSVFNSECDASGTLKLPIGSVDVIRITTSVSVHVEVEAKIGSTWYPGGSQDQDHKYYNFLANNCGYIITTVTEKTGNPLIGTVEYRTSKLLNIPGNKVVSNKVWIFPNPNNGNTLHIGLEGRAQVRVFDVAGHEVSIHDLDGISQSINIEGLAPGAYILRITADNGSIGTARLVKE